ncbi:MAG: hypothetical protein IJW77_05160 [Clostridia bacterium]|nr:hypothetical protein [Clostridia bacterium]
MSLRPVKEQYRQVLLFYYSVGQDYPTCGWKNGGSCQFFVVIYGRHSFGLALGASPCKMKVLSLRPGKREMKNLPFFLYYQAFSALFGCGFFVFCSQKCTGKYAENEVGT